ncbi:MAG: hypothetical protein IT305_02025 [Chloroflexi bacterium]|nr:hypothetical protein [Chloroflexota bacterium]
MTDPRLAFGQGIAPTAGDRILEALDSVRPVIHLSRDLPPTATAAAVALYSIVGRMLPHVVIEGEAELGPNPWGMRTAGEAVAALAATRPSATRSPSYDMPLGVGGASPDDALAIGGGPWAAHLGRGPLSIDPTGPGLGLQAAAALLAAEVAKRILGPLGFANRPLDGDFTWNVLDFQNRPAPLVAAAPTHTPAVALLGVGSVGSSVAGVLATMPQIVGHVDIIDGDTFDPIRNTFRYPSSSGGESGPKVDWISSLFSKVGVATTPTFGSVADWVVGRDNAGFDGLAISSVDGISGRFEVADVLARTTISIGVDRLALHAQREVLGDGNACPYCDFLDVTPPLSQAQTWAQLSGLSVERVIALIVHEERLRHDDVTAAVAAGRLLPERAEALVGRRLIDLIGRAYAEATVPVEAGSPIAVSAPFVSWMGGVLGAAEVAKAAYGLPLVDRRVDLDLSGLPSGFTLKRTADTSGRCACASPVRRRWMHMMYQ